MYCPWEAETGISNKDKLFEKLRKIITYGNKMAVRSSPGQLENNYGRPLRDQFKLRLVTVFYIHFLWPYFKTLYLRSPINSARLDKIYFQGTGSLDQKGPVSFIEGRQVIRVTKKKTMIFHSFSLIVQNTGYVFVVSGISLFRIGQVE